MELTGYNFLFSQWLFIKLLALNYFFAFGSLFLQVKGLYGSNGIIPIKDLLAAVEKHYGHKPFLRLPTIFWWDSNDGMLQQITIIGMIASLFIIIGIAPTPLLIFLWVAYLSFLSAGSTFLSFQWDILLVETGFIGIFFSIQSPPPMLLVIALWVLLFRLNFSSGMVKLLSGCKEWRDLTAMYYHYETQPLPNKLGYYAHQQSNRFAKFSVLGTYFLEIVVPFLIFLPDPFRLIAFFLLLFMQLLIMLTGNYAFFNTLSITLCIPLLTNDQLAWLFHVPHTTTFNPNYFLEIVLNIVGLVIIILNVFVLLELFFPLRMFRRFHQIMGAYNIVNPYGLFANMTTIRNEIIIEGSDDGVHWKEYEFKWKPGNLKTPPKQVAPHQPRLDWQMWFAALSHYQNNPWFNQLLIKILQDSPEVLALLKTNPFKSTPPKFVRSLLYRYHFTDPRTKMQTGEWWSRKFLGEYSPAMTLKKE